MPPVTTKASVAPASILDIDPSFIAYPRQIGVIVPMARGGVMETTSLLVPSSSCRVSPALAKVSAGCFLCCDMHNDERPRTGMIRGRAVPRKTVHATCVHVGGAVEW